MCAEDGTEAARQAMPGSRSLHSFRRIVVRGITALFIANLSGRLAGIAAIYVTGTVLSKQDFALYAIALAWGEIFGFMQGGGLHRFLLQRARSFDNLYAPVLGLSLTINSIWFLILAALAPFVSHAYDAKGVTTLIVLFALSIPAGTVALLLRAHLMVHLRFAELSKLSIYSGLIRGGGIILLALTGFGPISFVLPLIAVALFESVYLARKRPSSWRPSFPRRRLFRALSRPLLWILISSLAMSLITNGDYLVIGALEDKTIVGVYFFGFQLTVAVISMFTRTLRSVFIPSFVALSEDRERQERAFVRSLEGGALMLFFIFFAVAAVAEPVVGWVWAGKWDAAVPVVEIIAIASLARVVSPLTQSLLEARGAWRMVAVMSWIEGIGLMASAAIGAFLGGLLEIALAVGAYMMLVGLLYLIVICRHTSLPLIAVGTSVLGPYAIAAASLAFAWTFCGLVAPHSGVLVETLVKGASFTAGFAAIIVLFRRDLMHTALDAMKTFRNRRDSEPPRQAP